MSLLTYMIFAFCALAVNCQTTDVCNMPGGSFGRCVNIRSCPSLLQILMEARSNAGLVNYLRTTRCGSEGSDPKVCCPNESAAPPPPVEKVYPEDYCGISNLTLGKIVGGVDARLGDLPWMAVLGYTDRNEVETDRPEWNCGGALVSAYHVITAAHCVDNRLYLVRLGELDLASETEGATPVDYRIARRIVHHGHDPLARVNDIAILRLQGKVKFSDLTVPICLPLSTQMRSNSFAKYRPFTSGWGSLKYNGDTATKLQTVQVLITSTAECQKAYRRYISNVVDERVVCAGSPQGGQDSCYGDSGGPLILPMPDPVTHKNVWYLIGVISYGALCAEPEYPSVHARVTAYIPWIQEQLAIDKTMIQ